MTIDEAIEHSKEMASRIEKENPNCDCAKQHAQLADWLIELKELRKKVKIYRCSLEKIIDSNSEKERDSFMKNIESKTEEILKKW